MPKAELINNPKRIRRRFIRNLKLALALGVSIALVPSSDLLATTNQPTNIKAEKPDIALIEQPGRLTTIFDRKNLNPKTT